MERFSRDLIALTAFAFVLGTLLYSSESFLSRYTLRYQFWNNDTVKSTDFFSTTSSMNDSNEAAKRFLGRLEVLHKSCPNYKQYRLRYAKSSAHQQSVLIVLIISMWYPPHSGVRIGTARSTLGATDQLSVKSDKIVEKYMSESMRGAVIITFYPIICLLKE